MLQILIDVQFFLANQDHSYVDLDRALIEPALPTLKVLKNDVRGVRSRHLIS